MRLSDISLKFGIALAFIGAGAGPLVLAFPAVLKIVRALWSHGALALPAVVVKNSENFGTSSLVVAASILVFSCGVTLLLVSIGRSFEYARSSPRARNFSYLTR